VRAIVFDFFGTLTDPAAEIHRRSSFSDTADALGIPLDTFWAAMGESFPERIIGRLGDTRQTLLAIARCGTSPTSDQLDAAVVAQKAGAESVRPPRPGALDLLDRLRAEGWRLGLISDCSSELCEAWPATPYATRLDAAVFSWQEGRRKPHPRLYATAANRLGVAAADCWFVGDGGSREHDGARQAGMRPILVTNAAHPEVTMLRSDPDPYRPELVIDDLAELPGLMKTW
jgi:putative hydrolase of the HAD superfamily